MKKSNLMGSLTLVRRRVFVLAIGLGFAAISGCESGKYINVSSVSVCARFMKAGAAEEGVATLRVIAYDVDGTTVNGSGDIHYYPFQRGCLLLDVSNRPGKTYDLGLRAVTEPNGMPQLEYVTKAPSVISVDELTLTVDGKRIGGTIVDYESRGAILRVDVDFDFDNPNAVAGDILAVWQKMFSKSKSWNFFSDRSTKEIPSGAISIKDKARTSSEGAI